MFELGLSVRAGDVDTVKNLLREGAEVSSRDSRGRTALHWACETKHKNMQRVVDVLLEAGAEVNAQDENKHLVDHPEDEGKVCLMNLRDEDGNAALHLASGSNNKEVVCLLLRKGAKVRVKNNNGMTALHYAARASAMDVVNVLVDYGGDVNAKSYCGNTPLHTASDWYSKEVVCLLLRKGAKVGVKNNDGMTALHCAAQTNATNVVEVLVHNGEDVNATDCDGNTPLHLASESCNKEVVCLLLRKGAKVGVQNNDGMTALHLAAKESSMDVVDVLVDNGEDVNAKSYSGNTPLHIASESRKKEVVCLLLRKGAHVGHTNKMGMSPLHCATSISAREIVYVLVDNGEDVNAKDFKGNSPLHYLATKYMIRRHLRGQIELELASIINFLAIRGAKLDEQNIHLETPHELIVKLPELRISEINVVEKSFITQIIRLKTLGMLEKEFDINWRLGPDFYGYVKDQCCQEIENMKPTMVVKDISLYEVLTHINQPFLLLPEDLLRIEEFLTSPDLLRRFPFYGDTLRITFQRAKLLTLAVLSFYTERRKQIVKELPYPVAERLSTFLSNEDLKSFIESE